MPTILEQSDLNEHESTLSNVTIIQVYASTSGHDDNEVDCFYQQPQEIIEKKIQRRTSWFYKGTGVLKLRRMHGQTGETFVDSTAMSRQIRKVSHFERLQPLAT